MAQEFAVKGLFLHENYCTCSYFITTFGRNKLSYELAILSSRGTWQCFKGWRGDVLYAAPSSMLALENNMPGNPGKTK